MSGDLLAQARLDVQKFSASGGFESDFVFTSKDGLITENVKGLMAKVGNNVDEYETGEFADYERVYISVSELDFSENYPLRNANGKVDLFGHTVTIIDSSNTQFYLRVAQVYPDGTLGMIALTLVKK